MSTPEPTTLDRFLAFADAVQAAYEQRNRPAYSETCTCGVTVESAAARLGMTVGAFTKALARAKTLEDSRFHDPSLSPNIGRLGTQDGPEPVREHQSGPNPTEAMTIGRGA